MRTPSVIIAGVVYRGGYKPHDGPQLIEDCRINDGRPTSADDVLLHSETGIDLATDCHVLNGQITHRDEIHRRLCSAVGRNPKLSIAEMAQVKARYWEGRYTIRELSERHRIDRKTVWNIIHGLTGWYV